MKVYLFLLLATGIDILFLDSMFHAPIIVLLFCIAVYHFVRSLGVKICIMEMISLIACLIYLLIPLLVYRYYNEHNALAKLYETTMPIEEKKYFLFALPGTLLLAIGLNTTVIRQRRTDFELIQNCKLYLRDNRILGLGLIFIGLLSAFSLNVVPNVFRAIVYFSSQLTFIGAFYLLHSNIKGKKWIMIIALALLILQSAYTAMYGELVFWSAFGLMILSIGSKISLMVKSSILIFAAGFILLLQSVKQEYRLAMWTGSIKGSKPSAMFQIAKDKIINPSSLIETKKLFAMATRMNQGFLVARTMNYVPRKEPYAKGETIIKALGAALVPRFIWKDKPEIGGREMICRFLGDCHKLKYSYDIGQLGEGYVNFGIIGGSLFMFFYGLFIRMSYSVVANLSIRNATLILWVPLLFFSALSLETDFLTFINSFFKAIIFCVVIYSGAKFIWCNRVAND